MELLAEYIGWDGQRQRLRLRVSCETPGDPDPFQGLLSGVAQLRERVAELFDPLVQREARVATARDGALNGDDEDDEDDENNIDNRTNSGGPSAKRPKPPS